MHAMNTSIAVCSCLFFIQIMFIEAFLSVAKDSTRSFAYLNSDSRRSTYVSKQQHLLAHSAVPNSMEDMILASWQPTVYIALAAIVLGVLSQTFINSMLQGDQGLSAFLKDGQGYNKSNFRPASTNDVEKSMKREDPLPWLKLPSLDFVEVAGQTSNAEVEAIVVKKLEALKMKLLSEGDQDKAKIIMSEMNELMEKYGFEYKED